MKNYRMTVPASVCFSVQAETLEEAKLKALNVMENARDNFDGQNIWIGEVEADARLYIGADAHAAVEDIEDIE
jgi:hypothetical protein